MPDNKIEEIPIEITPADLSEQALAGIVENFILREGTDYGAVEVSFKKKSKQVLKQIESGLIKIVFDQTSQSVSILTLQDFKSKHSET